MGVNKQKLIPLFDDDFAVANLQAQVPWSYAECAYGLVYLLGVIIALIWMRRAFRRGILLLFAVQILIIQVTVLHFTPKIEAFSQRAAIEYYSSFAGKDVYLKPLGFVSYAYLFYAQKQPSQNPEYYKHKTEWLLNGKVDKPVYFITRITDTALGKPSQSPADRR